MSFVIRTIFSRKSIGKNYSKSQSDWFDENNKKIKTLVRSESANKKLNTGFTFVNNS